jgi:aspartate ammonia-lyase
MNDAGDPARLRYCGKSTTLALENFPPSGRRLRDAPTFIAGYARVKGAAAAANAELGVIDPAVAAAIVAAAAEVAGGEHLDEFRLPLVQGGAGTSTNMNLNEVLASRAEEILAEAGNATHVHPNDHVNRSQSTNDTYPTAMAITLLDAGDAALASLDHLAGSLREAARSHQDLERLGRTHLRDAVSLTVGDCHSAHAAAVVRTREGLAEALMNLRRLPLGGTVLGSGIGAPEGFALAAVTHLSRLTGRDLSVMDNLFDAMANADQYASLAAGCTAAAMVMAKIANDLRFLSSGPQSGISEVALPELQPGSSIMPGKVNPVIPEYVLQLSFRVRGCAHTVEAAVAASELELNVMKPVILDALLTAFGDLAVAGHVFAEKCIDGLAWNEGVLAGNIANSVGPYVELATEAGYDLATAAARAPESSLAAPRR